MPTLYRAMRPDEDGLPRVYSMAGWGLGVREGWDIDPDEDGIVHPQTGGMSVVTAPEHLPRHRRPAALGGTGTEGVWQIDTEELPEYLDYQPDPGDAPRHGLIEPAYSMDLDDFQEAIASTRGFWLRLA